MGRETDGLNRHFGFTPSEVDALVLSHGHIDHCGLLPKLVGEGFSGPVYCTPATAEVAAVLMQDSARIQESDIKYANRKRKQEGRALLQPLYTVEDAEKALQLFRPVDYNQWFAIMDGVALQFTDAGHIIGSAAVHLKIEEGGRQRQLTFSGDLGRYRDVILRSPAPFPQADFIIMESTYGNSLHASISSSVDTLLQWIEKTCVQRRGKLILPAFSLGRTQELLYALNQLSLENRLPQIDYFLDSPLSITTTDLVKHYPQYFNEKIQEVLKKDKDPFHFPGLQYVASVEDSKMLNYHNEPCVIISASGMAEAGRVKHHISNNIENSRNAVLMTGYCEPNSLGGRLIAGQKEVSIFGIDHEVHAQIGAIKSMSAHGDYEDMHQWLGSQEQRNVKHLFLVHGEYDVQRDFKQYLLQKGFPDVVIPEQHQEFNLG
jgi:metallo-beta-lactamase family protein